MEIFSVLLQVVARAGEERKEGRREEREVGWREGREVGWREEREVGWREYLIRSAARVQDKTTQTMAGEGNDPPC